MAKSLLICLLAFCLICPLSYAQIQEDFVKIKSISDEVVKDCSANGEKVLALSHFVYLKLTADASKGISPNVGMSTIDRLDSGVGWCNHQVAVFMRLAEAQHISTRMLYLLNKEGTSSPHTIGEALIDGKWVIVDPQNDFIGLYSRYEVLHNPNLIKNEPSIQAKFKEQPKEKLNEYVDLYTNPAIFVYGLDGL